MVGHLQERIIEIGKEKKFVSMAVAERVFGKGFKYDMNKLMELGLFDLVRNNRTNELMWMFKE